MLDTARTILEREGGVNSGLLATKLHRPATPPGRIPRPHLLRRLDEGLASGRQIILVSAPAGFGKTTCIGEWLDTLDHWPVAWLSLDEAEWLVMQCLYLVMQGKAMEGRTLATRALEMATGQDNRLQGLAYFGLAYANEILEDHEAVVEAYQRAIQHSRAAGDLVIEMMSTAGLARLALEQGRLHLAFEIAAAVSARLDEGRALPPISTVVFGILGEVCYQWHQIDEAQHHAKRALQLSTMGGYNSGLINLRTLLSRLSQLDGDLEGAAREIRQAADLVKVDTPDYVRQESISQQVRVYLARNRPAAAEMVLQGQGFSFRDRFSFPAPSPGRSISHSLGLVYNSSLHLLGQKARAGGDSNDLTSGIELADAVIADALRGGRRLVALEALLLRAQMYSLLGESQTESGARRASHLEACRADYVRALRLGEPEGIIGSFVEHGPPVARAVADLAEQEQIGGVAPDYVERLLVAFGRVQGPGSTGGPQAVKPPARSEGMADMDTDGLVEPLTERELDVLRLMTRGLKYREIAAELFISLNTVRSHIKAIYGKLLVNNRTRAVEKARRLGIL